MRKLNIQEIEPSRLRPNPFNTNIVSPENEAKIAAGLERLDWFKPILCRELADGALEIIGGEHRWRAAQRLGQAQVPVLNLGPLDDQRAKEIGLADNARYGEDDTLRLGELLRELGDVDDIASFLPYTNDDIDHIFAASTICLDDLGLGEGSDSEPLPDLPTKAGQTHQLMRFKVPLGDCDFVERLIERTMKQQGFTQEDSLSNAGNALVHLLRSLS